MFYVVPPNLVSERDLILLPLHLWSKEPKNNILCYWKLPLMLWALYGKTQPDKEPFKNLILGVCITVSFCKIPRD